MYVPLVFRLLLCVSLASSFLEARSNSVPRLKTKFTVNSRNEAVFSDVILSAEVNTSSEIFHKDGTIRRFNSNINKVYVWVNEENCWHINNKGQWKRNIMRCNDAHGIKRIKLENDKESFQHKVTSNRRYRYGYH
ncbi:hypothetical protein LSTR_LSTR013261 [Laodelphax striatellus]|uniref:Uncharacterized protein n=1 Tax=Laodelphax striatellus TaxID=195883 RepID=A0A482X8D8_LAOST|nr:hypothetical protein LSTR_LSTR013261 [Laodelphax striatellus]